MTSSGDASGLERACTIPESSRVLGAAGSTVYLALDLVLPRYAAIKQYSFRCHQSHRTGRAEAAAANSAIPSMNS